MAKEDGEVVGPFQSVEVVFLDPAALEDYTASQVSFVSLSSTE